MKRRTPPRPTLKSIAAKAGVSVAAVSLALRDHPSIPAATCRRIQAIATKLGYRPDPELRKLMAYLRQRREIRTTAALGLLTMFPEAHPWDRNPILRRHLAGATDRAQQLGYHLADFWLTEPGMTAERMRKILDARGIEGLLILGTPTWVERIDFDFSRFACAAIGYSVRMPVHRASPHQYEELAQTMRQLERLGYRRPGLILSEDSDQRTLRHYSSAFLRWQWQLPKNRCVPLNLLPEPNFESFRSWFKAHEPDVVVAQAPAAPVYLDWLRRLGRPAPESCGFASLDIDPSLDFVCSGIRQNCEMIAAAAVDLIVAQLQRRERGLPTLPKTTLIEGEWINGSTTRAQ